MQIIIDRFEGNFAIAELPNGNFADVPRSILPPDAKEGDVINLDIDHDKTQERREMALKLTKKLMAK